MTKKKSGVEVMYLVRRCEVSKDSVLRATRKLKMERFLTLDKATGKYMACVSAKDGARLLEYFGLVK